MPNQPLMTEAQFEALERWIAASARSAALVEERDAAREIAHARAKTLFCGTDETEEVK